MQFSTTVIGEAAAQVSRETRAQTEIPWAKVFGLRNLVTHEYFRVDLEIIEAIIAEQLDPLEQAVSRLLGET